MAWRNGWFVVPQRVAFRDLDAMGHVNNATFITYLESARLAWWLKTTQRTGIDALDLILARTEIDYRSQLNWGESVDVAVRCASMGAKSFVLEFRMTESGSGRLVAEARKVNVYFDFGANRSAPIPEAIRALIRAQDPEVEE